MLRWGMLTAMRTLVHTALALSAASRLLLGVAVAAVVQAP
jgi:hypothetical protein